MGNSHSTPHDQYREVDNDFVAGTTRLCVELSSVAVLTDSLAQESRERPNLSDGCLQEFPRCDHGVALERTDCSVGEPTSGSNDIYPWKTAMRNGRYELTWLAFAQERMGLTSRLKLERRIAIVVYPGVSLLDLGGPLEAFRVASEFAGNRVRRLNYKCSVVSSRD